MDPNEINEVVIEPAVAIVDVAERPLCRFCWGEELTHNNPLLSTCKCCGGIKYIHFLCLKEWLNSKRHVKEQSNLVTLSYKCFECELCKTPYPLHFRS